MKQKMVKSKLLIKIESLMFKETVCVNIMLISYNDYIVMHICTNFLLQVLIVTN